jgi:uncharacterized membrane protein YccF (DUF307 family)
MSTISILLNIVWILFGGFWMALGWVVAALLMAITIIGLPWTFAAFRIANYTLLPFGRTVLSRDEVEGEVGAAEGALGCIGNLIWLFLAGWWLALGHVVTAVLLAITIIGLPFAWAHFKLAALALWPIGRVIVDNAEAERIRSGLGRV